jgi:hypothetical protein
MMIRNVSANTSSSLRSIPGSCCGLLNSAKSVARYWVVWGRAPSPVQPSEARQSSVNWVVWGHAPRPYMPSEPGPPSSPVFA